MLHGIMQIRLELMSSKQPSYFSLTARLTICSAAWRTLRVRWKHLSR